MGEVTGMKKRKKMPASGLWSVKVTLNSGYIEVPSSSCHPK